MCIVYTTHTHTHHGHTSYLQNYDRVVDRSRYTVGKRLTIQLLLNRSVVAM